MVSLVTGEEVSNYSQLWRAETGARHAEAIWILSSPEDMENQLVAAAARLGGGDEQVRRLRAAVHGMVRDRLDEHASDVLALAYLEDRRSEADRFEARWGEELGAALRERILAIWTERRAKVAAEAE